ncbi:hypothetical protein DFJ73DRAFT_817137 [Zopfochytrium polystomum]|nr:hypothetical protein DFJ73DRAFT_817137 [Zopfochytrium polystomum]
MRRAVEALWAFLFDLKAAKNEVVWIVANTNWGTTQQATALESNGTERLTTAIITGQRRRRAIDATMTTRRSRSAVNSTNSLSTSAFENVSHTALRPVPTGTRSL